MIAFTPPRGGHGAARTLLFLRGQGLWYLFLVVLSVLFPIHDGGADWDQTTKHYFPVGRVLGTRDSSLPDKSICIIEGGMARVIDEAPDPNLFILFQNDVCEVFTTCAGDEQSQAS